MIMNNCNEQLAFIFPGQGSQKIGMLADMTEQFPLIIDYFNQASEVLGYDLWDLVQNGEQAAINMTEVTQPLLLTASIALWHCWQQSDNAAKPAALAGHSLGEWSALVAADVVTFADAVQLVRKRGAYMQSACKPGEGAMYAIVGLEDHMVENICEETSIDEFVAPVNYNAPGQLVIAGYAGASETAAQRCKEAGAKMTVALPVSAPFHTPLMKPAATNLAEDILKTDFHAPKIPIIHNASLSSTANTESIQQLMIDQITAPVPWVKTIQTLQSTGATAFVECGPGKVLCGLNKRIDRNLKAYSIDSINSLQLALSNII